MKKTATATSFKVGDLVGYKSMLEDQHFQHQGKVHTVLNEGIPSLPEPVVWIEGKAGCVLASHCTLIHPSVPGVK